MIPLFLLEDLADPLPAVGTPVRLDGEEGRHAALVRRIRPGETISSATAADGPSPPGR